jgi:hypothetical protein
MANTKISALTSATTPLAGTETLPVVQSGVTTKVTVDNLTAGRAISALSATLTNALSATSGGTGLTTIPTNGQLLIGNGTSYALNTLSAGTNISIVNASGTITISSTGGGSSGSGNAYAWFIST